MVDLTLLEINVQQQSNIEETDHEHHKEKRQDLINANGKGATKSERSSQGTHDPHYFQNHHGAVMGNASLQQNNLSSKVKTLAGTAEISPHLSVR